MPRPLPVLTLALFALGSATATRARADAPLPTVELTIPDEAGPPAVAHGTYQPRRYATGFAASEFAAAERPDFILHVTRDVQRLRFAVVGRDATIYASRAASYRSGDRHQQLGQMQFDAGDWVIWLRVRADATGEWTVVVWDADKSTLAPTERFGAPTDDADVAQRALSRYAPYFATPRCDRATPATAELAHALFTSLPRSFFVWPAQPLPSGGRDAPASQTEPVVLLHGERPDSYPVENTSFTALTSDGGCYQAMGPRWFTTRPPATSALPPPRPLTIVLARDTKDYRHDEAFVAVAEPAVAARYREKRIKAWACYDRVWDELDPNLNASRFAVAHTSNGQVTKIEDLTTKFDRVARARCKMGPFLKERDALESTVLDQLAKRRITWRADAAAYLGGLGIPVAP